ncbi:MAG: SGNH/GDSL hydrolase family protein [Planctomycetota bacterium]
MTKKPLTAALLAFVLTLAVADGVASWASDIFALSFRGYHDNAVFMQAPVQGLGYVWKPGARIWGTWINPQGLRSDELEINTTSPRIAFLGDSVTAGQRGPLNGTLPMVVGRFMEAPVHGYEIINAGLSGTNALQQAAFLEHTVLPLKPDVVVWVFTPTHLSSPHTTMDSSDAAFHEIETEAWLKSQREREAGEALHLRLPGKPWLREHSLLYGFSANVWHNSLVILKVRPPENRALEASKHRREIEQLALGEGEPWRIVSQGLRRMEELALREGFQLKIVYIPPREHVEAGSDPLSEQLLPRLAKDRWVLDLAPLLIQEASGSPDGARALYMDASHLNAKGVELCARAIAESRGLVRAGGRP